MTTALAHEAEPRTENTPAWLAGFKADYDTLFVEGWSPYLGSILVVLVIVGLMISGLWWGVFGGLRLWGDWFNSAIGLGPLLGLPQTLEGPLLERISLINITLLLGAFCAALLSRQFRISRPAISHHLKVLKDAGIVRSEKIGQEIYYRLDAARVIAGLRQIADTIESCCPPE